MGGSGGFLTVGGPDNEHCTGPWRDVRLESRARSWEFRVYGFQIGKYISYRSYSASVNTGTALIGGPPHLINTIIASTDAEFREKDNLYIVQCDQRSKMEPFKLKLINGNHIQIPPSEYVLDLNLTDGECALGVFGMFGDEYTTDWVLGDLFLDSFCTMFDYGNGRLSFANAKDSIPYEPGEKFNASLHVQPGTVHQQRQHQQDES